MNADDLDDVMLPNADFASSLSASSSRSIHEFIRYFSASLIGLVADAGTLALLTSFFGVPYLISGALSFTLGLVIVYLLSIRWVFEHRVVENLFIEFLLFAGVGLVGLGLNELVLYVLTGSLGLFYLLSKAASVIVVFTWNYAARKYLLFRAS